MSVDVANPLAQGVCALGDGMRRKKRRPPGPGTTASAAPTATSRSGVPSGDGGVEELGGAVLGDRAQGDEDEDAALMECADVGLGDVVIEARLHQ
jgi:hypothetical protein